MNKSFINLKNIFLQVLIIVSLLSLANANDDSKLLTKWVNEAGTGFIQLNISEDGTLEGIGAEGGDKNRKDLNNPDPKLREKPLLGSKILWGFRPNNESRTEWIDGKIYDPDNGKTYSCKIKLKKSELEIRGFVGIPLFGRTTIWKRAEPNANTK